MEPKPSPFSGVLAVIAIGLLILSIGGGYIAFVLMEERKTKRDRPTMITTNASGKGRPAATNLSAPRAAP